MEITKDQAKLFLTLLNTVEFLPKEDNLLKQTIGDFQVGIMDTFLLKKKLEEFIGE